MAATIVTLQDHDSAWAGSFDRLAKEVRSVLGDSPVRIHHIGSTAVPGLAAKPIIDIQMSVDTWDEFDALRDGLESLGWEWMPDNDDRRKRYFRLSRGGRRVGNLHIRLWGEFSSQAALLFRDYLRTDSSARERYEATKRELAESTWESIDHYADAKGDVIWTLLREADVWAWGVAWAPGSSDG